MNATENDIRRLHEQLLSAWNRSDAAGMAALYAAKGSQVGFDGSIANGPAEIEAHLRPIFASHQVARFVWKVREVRSMGPDAALLRAVAGMIPPGESRIKPERNAIQSLVASRDDSGDWRIEMFQNTPARFDGRPEETEKLSSELQEVASSQA